MGTWIWPKLTWRDKARLLGSRVCRPRLGIWNGDLDGPSQQRSRGGSWTTARAGERPTPRGSAGKESISGAHWKSENSFYSRNLLTGFCFKSPVCRNFFSGKWLLQYTTSIEVERELFFGGFVQWKEVRKSLVRLSFECVFDVRVSVDLGLLYLGSS
jgi:hypothetical protein